MTKDANQQIKEYFDALYPSALKEAELEAVLFMENLELQELEPYELALKLQYEIELLDNETAACKFKDYMYFVFNKALSYRTFSGHILFEIDSLEEEKARLLQAFLLSIKRSHLFTLYEKTEAQLPPFTFLDFLNSNRKVFCFNKQPSPVGITEEEYYKIKNWQIKKMVECVSLELMIFRDRFINEAGDSPIINDLIKSEIKQLAYIFKNGYQLSTTQFIEELLKLKVLAPNALPENLDEFHKTFFLTNNSGILPSFTPQFVKSTIENIQSGKISHPPISYCTFYKYYIWLTDV